MSLNPGQSPRPAQTDEQTRLAAEPIAEGDAVTTNASDEVLPAGDTDVVLGVAGDDHILDNGYSEGDNLTVITQGPVVANVAAGVGSSVEVAGSTTAGELAAGDSAQGIVTEFAEGVAKEDIPAGFGVVNV
jgi:hypothetical protein